MRGLLRSGTGHQPIQHRTGSDKIPIRVYFAPGRHRDSLDCAPSLHWAGACMKAIITCPWRWGNSRWQERTRIHKATMRFLGSRDASAWSISNMTRPWVSRTLAAGSRVALSQLGGRGWGSETTHDWVCAGAVQISLSCGALLGKPGPRR